MVGDSEAIKQELQGDGYLKELKDEHNESVEKTSQLAIEKYEENNQEITPSLLQDSFSEVIIGLIGYETDIFESRYDEVYPKALVHFLEDHYNSGQASVSSYTTSGEPEIAEYSAIREKFREIEREFNTHDDFTEVFTRVIPEMYELIEPIVQSAGQSSSKRAGEAFRQQFSNLLELAGYNIWSQSSQGNGYTFILSPDDSNVSKEIHFGFHTTLRDRFRSSLSDAPDSIPKYIVTAAGTDAISEDDSEDVTSERITEIEDAEYKLIAIDKVADQFPNRDSVLSYEQFISEDLPSHFE